MTLEEDIKEIKSFCYFMGDMKITRSIDRVLGALAILQTKAEELEILQEALEVREHLDTHLDNCNMCNPGGNALPCGGQELAIIVHMTKRIAMNKLLRDDRTKNILARIKIDYFNRIKKSNIKDAKNDPPNPGWFLEGE